jgi:Asp-tRNA(Asn)/Glu-tRNA(Gln) amidotransferase A subunit family amidase
MPLGVQIAAKTNQDEKLLGVMKQIEEEFQFHQFAK